MSFVSRLFEQWCDDWAYMFVVAATIGLSVACCGLISLPVWVVADLVESDAFPDDSVFWGSGAWIVSFIVFGPSFLRQCRPAIEGWGRGEGRN